MLEQLASFHELHYKVELGGCLESIGQVHQIWMIDVR